MCIAHSLIYIKKGEVITYEKEILQWMKLLRTVINMALFIKEGDLWWSC